VSHFEPAERSAGSLFADREEKGRKISAVMDRMREKFGPAALAPARMAALQKQRTKQEEEGEQS